MARKRHLEPEGSPALPSDGAGAPLGSGTCPPRGRPRPPLEGGRLGGGRGNPRRGVSRPRPPSCCLSPFLLIAGQVALIVFLQSHLQYCLHVYHSPLLVCFYYSLSLVSLPSHVPLGWLMVFFSLWLPCYHYCIYFGYLFLVLWVCVSGLLPFF